MVAEDLHRRALQTLRDVMANESRWIKVHAAEFLLAVDQPQSVRDTFLRELEQYGDQPQYRIGIWRVLCRATTNRAEAEQWMQRIVDVLKDPAGPDRLHAMETLAKLGWKPSSDERQMVEQEAQAGEQQPSAMAAFAAWILAQSGQTLENLSRLPRMLEQGDPAVRATAAYCMRQPGVVYRVTRESPIAMAKTEPQDSQARVHLVCLVARQTTNPDRASQEWGRDELLRYVNDPHAPVGSRYHAADVLGQISRRQTFASDLSLFESLLNDPAADVRSAAAAGILRIERQCAGYG